MNRGRPVFSEIRQNIIEILFYLGKGYGYQVSKIYQKIFPACTREVIYYHLKKGVDLGEIKIKEVKNDFVHKKDDILTLNNQVKSDQSEILVLDNMID